MSKLDKRIPLPTLAQVPSTILLSLHFICLVETMSKVPVLQNVVATVSLDELKKKCSEDGEGKLVFWHEITESQVDLLLPYRRALDC